MGQYIDKSALVAEIEKNKNKMEPERDWYFDEYTNGYLDALKEALSIINTLEVKEVEEDTDKYLSEEDESRMDNLCHFLEEYGNQYYGHLTLQGTISWLKSLRPQNRWKPSDEQMETLELIINSHSLDAYHLGMAQHLYNGLKTLKD